MGVFSNTVDFFKEGIVRQDAFGVDVGLTYKNKTKYKTMYGGWATILIHVIMIAYAVYLFSEWDDQYGCESTNATVTSSAGTNQTSAPVYNVTETIYSNEDLQWTIQYNTKTIVSSTKDLPQINDFVYPFQKGLGIAVKLSTGIDTSVAFLEFFLRAKNETDENIEYHLLQSELWTESTFPYRNWTEALEYGIDEYYWLSSDNVEFTKFTTTDVVSDLIVHISLWQNTTSCSNTTVIQEAVYGANVKVRFIDTYFDPNDANEPIKTYINSDISMLISYAHWTDTSIALRPNVFTYENGTSVEFYSIRTQYMTQSYYNSFYLGAIRLSIDSLTNLHDRHQYYQPIVTNRNRRV